MISLRSPFRWLPALTIFFLVLLILVPATGWLVGAQFRTLFRPIPGATRAIKNGGYIEAIFQMGGDYQSESTARQAEADKHPSDYPIQLAAAVEMPFSSESSRFAEVAARFHHLSVRFPRHPAVYAHWLRRLARMEFVHRNEEDLLFGEKPGDYEWSNPTPRAFLAQMDDVAMAGEQADPDNAYFPLLRAAGLFGMHQDDKAMDALERASWKPNWNDYSLEDEQAALRLNESMFGTSGYFDRLLVWKGQRHPEYSSLRELAWVATYKAVLAEHEGHYRDGLAIRERLMRCGHNIRIHSTGIYDVLFGITITEIARIRPGGIPYVEDRSLLTWQSSIVAKNQAYTAYLRRQGYLESAAWAKGELEIDEGIWGLEKDAIARSPVGPETARSVILWWVVDLDLLANVLCLLWVAGVLNLPWRRRWYAHALAVLTAWGVPGLFLWFRPWQANFTDIFVMATGWGNDYDTGVEWPWMALPSVTVVQGVTVVVSLLIPLLLLLCLTIRAGRRKEPVWESVTQALRTVGPILACLLLIVYSGALLRTLQVDTDSSRQFDQMLPIEAQYMYSNLGESWPNPRHRAETLVYESPGTFH